MLPKDQVKHYQDHGYLILKEALHEGMLEPLRKATDRVTRRARRGDWPHIRKATDNDIWGVSHLLHPDLGEGIFAEYLASSVVIDVVGDLLAIAPDSRSKELQLELANMLVNPAMRDHEIGWHRDLVRGDMSPEKELVELHQRERGIQWNTALYDEACLLIIPGSHLRSKTPEERDVVFNRPRDPIPGKMIISLEAGQGVYYNANLIHRGVYSNSERRETLHCCMGAVDNTLLRPHIYTGLAWMDRPGFRISLPQALQPLYDNFLKMKLKYDALPVKPQRV